MGQYTAWIEPFPGELLCKGELCWVQHGIEALDGNFDNFWFEPMDIDMEIFKEKSLGATPENMVFELGPGTAKLLHGMIVPYKSPNLLCRAIASDKRAK